MTDSTSATPTTSTPGSIDFGIGPKLISAGIPKPGLMTRIVGSLVDERDLLAAMIVKVVGAVTSFGATFVIASRYGAETVGLYAIFTQTMTTFSMFAVFGNELHIVRAVAGNMALNHESRARELVVRGATSVAWLALLFAAGFVVTAILGFDLFLDPTLLSLVAIGLLANAALVYCAAVIRGLHRVVASQLIQTMGSFAMLALAVGLWFIPVSAPVLILSLAYTAATIISALVAFALVLKPALRWKNSTASYAPEVVESQFQFGLISSINFANVWVLLTAMGFLVGKAEAGVFRVCFQFLSLILMLIQTYHSTLSPQFAKLTAIGDFRGAGRLLRRSQILQTIICGVPALVVAVFAERILAIMGPEFVQGAATLRIMAIGTGVTAMFGAGGPLLTMSRRETTVLWLSIASFASVTTIVAIFAPTLGLLAAAIALTVSSSIRLVGSWWVARRWLAAKLAEGAGEANSG